MISNEVFKPQSEAQIFHSSMAQKLTGVYEYIEELYGAHNTLRFRGINELPQNETLNRKESIGEHMWIATVLCSKLVKICPQLFKVADAEEIKDILLEHDVPEINNVGDITRIAQMLPGFNKEEKLKRERTNLEKISAPLGKEEQKKALSLFDYFETDSPEAPLEIMVAQILDTIQGDHYFFTFAKQTDKSRERAFNYFQKGPLPQFRALISRLLAEGHQEAANEVVEIALKHIDFYRENGIRVDDIKTLEFGHQERFERSFWISTNSSEEEKPAQARFEF